MPHCTMTALHRFPLRNAPTSTEAPRSWLPWTVGLFRQLLNKMPLRPDRMVEPDWLDTDDIARLRNRFHTTWFKSSALGQPEQPNAFKAAVTGLSHERGYQPRQRSTGFSQLRSPS